MGESSVCIKRAIYVYAICTHASVRSSVRSFVCPDCLEKRACKISKGTARVHGAPYSPVRNRRRDLQATWEFLSSLPTEFLSTFPRAIRVSLSVARAMERTEDVTRDDPASSTELTFRLKLLLDFLSLSFSLCPSFFLFYSTVCPYILLT